MKVDLRRYRSDQSGFTLVEVVIASALGLMVITGLTSVILTSIKATSIATSRIEASGQIRNFELHAYDDFALSAIPDTAGCGAPPWSCPIKLAGTQVTNSVTPTVDPTYKVSYSWDGTAVLDRQVGGNPPAHVAKNITDFSWWVEGSALHQTVVVKLGVTVPLPRSSGPAFAFAGDPYTEYQILRFYPRVNS